MKTGFIYDQGFLAHDPGPGHPECRERLVSSMKYLETRGWFNSLLQLSPAPVDYHWLEQIHSRAYIDRARSTCLSGAPWLDTMDVGISRDSFDTALLAAGAGVVLADELLDRRTIDNGFALLRPPGHHAENSEALGFCLFNNIAILARYVQKQYGIGKVVILDWDVHHGNGTQHSFEDDPSVLYISTHQYPYYPGTGAASETGTGRGKGTTLNCPMPAHSGDREYEAVFRDRILPAIEAFRPGIILVSAGFDAHVDDPLAQINLSTEFFGWMTERLLELADQNCQGRILSLLEGGYNLQALPRCIEQHLLKLTGTRN